jgi:hypothetical protein
MGIGSQHVGAVISFASGELSVYFHGYTLTWASIFEAINLFIGSADALFGPITTVRTNGRISKKIPWSAFRMSNLDWERVKDVKDILTVCSFFARVHPHDALTSHIRILKISNIPSHPSDFRLSGARSLQLKSCKPHGRQGATTPTLLNTGVQLQTVWRSLKNTIRASTRSPATFSR